VRAVHIRPGWPHARAAPLSSNLPSPAALLRRLLPPSAALAAATNVEISWPSQADKDEFEGVRLAPPWASKRSN
jgi:hypothetical protein